MTLENIRDQIAEVMGWSRKDVDTFSLPTLRNLVRGKATELDRILKDVIEGELHWFLTPS